MKNVLVLAFEGAQILDIAGPMEVFAHANHLIPKPAYRVVCVGATGSTVGVSSGMRLDTTAYSRWRGAVDTLIVPGGSEEGLQALRDVPAFQRWLRRRVDAARRIVSVCTGAFVLADLGVLDGRRVSTHWGAVDRLQAFCPKATVDPEAIYTRDGHVYTSAGVTTGIDLALSLVEEDLGKQVALQIARHLVIYYRRPGGQSQFSVPLEQQSTPESRIEKVAEYIRNHPKADLTVEALAARFALSARHLTRLFQHKFGVSPARFVAQSRLSEARRYLEESALPLKQIASRCGFSSTDAMSRLFKQKFGVAPGQYRRQFA